MSGIKFYLLTPVLKKACTRMVGPLLCATRSSNILCGGSVRSPIFSTFRYGYEV